MVDLSAKDNDAVPVARMVEDVIGCKWSLSVLDCVHRGIVRPGEMERAIVGIRTKVLNERLQKLLRFGVLSKHTFAELPPHVEYHLTQFGKEFSALLEQIRRLDARRRAE